MQITHVTIKAYVAIKPFTYAGKAYVRGDAWEPLGFRNDEAMISGRFVVERKEALADPVLVDPTLAEPILADVLNNTPARRGRRVTE